MLGAARARCPQICGVGLRRLAPYSGSRRLTFGRSTPSFAHNDPMSPRLTSAQAQPRPTTPSFCPYYTFTTGPRGRVVGETTGVAHAAARRSESRRHSFTVSCGPIRRCGEFGAFLATTVRGGRGSISHPKPSFKAQERSESCRALRMGGAFQRQHAPGAAHLVQVVVRRHRRRSVGLNPMESVMQTIRRTGRSVVGRSLSCRSDARSRT